MDTPEGNFFFKETSRRSARFRSSEPRFSLLEPASLLVPAFDQGFADPFESRHRTSPEWPTRWGHDFRQGRNIPQLAQVRGVWENYSPSFRVHVHMALFCMSKQSEAPKIGDDKNRQLREEHTPRTSDRVYVITLTESGVINHHHRITNAMMRIFSSETMPRYRLLAARGTPLLAPRATFSCSVNYLIDDVVVLLSTSACRFSDSISAHGMT